MGENTNLALIRQKTPGAPSQIIKLKVGDPLRHGKITQISYDGLDYIEDGKTTHLPFGSTVDLP